MCHRGCARLTGGPRACCQKATSLRRRRIATFPLPGSEAASRGSAGLPGERSHDATAVCLLDDHPRQPADRVSRAGTGDAAADAQAVAVEEPRRGDEVVCERTVVGVAGRRPAPAADCLSPSARQGSAGPGLEARGPARRRETPLQGAEEPVRKAPPGGRPVTRPGGSAGMARAARIPGTEDAGWTERKPRQEAAQVGLTSC